MNTTSAAVINATEASKKLVAVCANSGRPFYVGATIDALTNAHQDVAGNRQEFSKCEKSEKADFTVYEVPAFVAEEIDGDSRIDFDSEFGKGVEYRVIAAIKDDEQNLSALKDAIAKARTVAKGYADLDKDGDYEAHYTGLSVNRTIDADGAVLWDISFDEDLSKTILYHSADFDARTKNDEEIAEIITGCWEHEWDEHDDR